MGEILILFVLIFVLWATYRISTSKERTKSKVLKALEEELQRLISEDIHTIARAYRASVSSNSFGKKNYQKFERELIEYVFDNINNPLIKKHEDSFWDFQIPNETMEAIENEILEFSNIEKYNTEMDPYEYEHFCAGQFKSSGWEEAEATTGSNDQGVDVTAKRGSEFLVAQCKKYSKPVGNKAVQEVVAGMKYYGANKGAVISTSGFTPSARKLASANNIALIHHSEIKNL
jgi:restriction system protein